MRRLKFIVVFVLVLLVFLSSTVYAHSGGTDAQGGHNSPDGYHYHHGYPAHQHENGECPYDFVDKSGESSGSSSGSSRTYPQYTPRPTVFELLPENEERKPAATAADEKENAVLLGAYVLFALICIVALTLYFLKRYSNKLDVKKQYIEKCLKLRKEYEGKTMRAVLQTVPDNVMIGADGLPRNIDADTHWGRDFTCYVCLFGKVYHRQECRIARVYTAYPRHIMKTAWLKPCSICNPDPFPDLEWVKEYHRLKKLFKKFMVPVVDDVAAPKEENQ